MIDANALIAPIGPLEAAPNEASNVFGVRVQAYIDQAYTDARITSVVDDEPRRDRMATALALYMGIMADYRRMLREPLTVTVTDKGSSGYSTKQLDGMLALAEAYKAEFDALVDVVASVPATVRAVAVPTFVCW